MNAKWSISNQPVLAAVICLLLLWCGALLRKKEIQ